MSRLLLYAACLSEGLVLFGVAGTASAQWHPAINPCQCRQPVVQTCYQTVPVTEYRPIRRTVQRPVLETKWVDRQVTEYRPVTETRTAHVPTVDFQDATECQTVQRNAGYWITRFEQRPRLSSCQYDPRPNVWGWLNRTGYSMRQTFTPSVIARREYVPRVVTQVIPVTRRVAHHGARQVSYNVTRMVPYTTTRKVAVNTVRYVAQQITTMRPVTVMRTVPIGSSMAFAPLGISSPQTALRLAPDPLGADRSGSRNLNRTARRPLKRGQRGASEFGNETTVPPREPSSHVHPRTSSRSGTPQVRYDDRFDGYRPIDSRSTTKYPSIIRVSRRWTPRSQSSIDPSLTPSSITIARSSH